MGPPAVNPRHQLQAFFAPFAYSQAADQHVWLAASAFMGPFVGTYSARAYAACAGWRGRERPARRVFPNDARVGTEHYAFPVHAYAVALPKLLQGLGGMISSSAQMSKGR